MPLYGQCVPGVRPGAADPAARRSAAGSSAAGARSRTGSGAGADSAAIVTPSTDHADVARTSQDVGLACTGPGDGCRRVRPPRTTRPWRTSRSGRGRVAPRSASRGTGGRRRRAVAPLPRSSRRRSSPSPRLGDRSVRPVRMSSARTSSDGEVGGRVVGHLPDESGLGAVRYQLTTEVRPDPPAASLRPAHDLAWCQPCPGQPLSGHRQDSPSGRTEKPERVTGIEPA